MRLTLLALAAILLTAPFAAADLLFDRFGVSLSVSFAVDQDAELGGPYGRYVFDHDWTPVGSPTANWSVHDYTGWWDPDDLTGGDSTQITGGEPYDVEAIYLDDDLTNLYIAVVTSFPSPDPNGGFFDARFNDDEFFLVHAGDLALDFGINGPISADDPFNYDWGVNINNEVRLESGGAEANATPALGGAVYQTENGDWYVSNEGYAADTPRGEMTNFDPEYVYFSGTYQGMADVSYYSVDFGEGILENGAETWVIEATIPFSALPSLKPGDLVSAQWVMGCRNDGGTENHVLRVDHEIVPEPGSLMLCAVGLGALVGWRRRNQSRA
ncbi:MAG: PEP-CTERM sorting domain-containing protein [Armatimonadota bacterium]|jgi:hypothetical protein